MPISFLLVASSRPNIIPTPRSWLPAPRFTNPLGDRAIALDRKSQRINEQIRYTPIRVIGAEGDQLGVLETAEALQRAKDLGLDLVEVAPQEKPPVCRIMDFGKFKYQQKKRQHKGHTHHSKNKELRVRPKIGDHDLMTKVNRAKEFLAEKDKVIFSVIFRGRENAHTEEGYKLVQPPAKGIGTGRQTRAIAAMQGRRIVVIFAPKVPTSVVLQAPARASLQLPAATASICPHDPISGLPGFATDFRFGAA
jgi:translation initiation factor IF-3